MDELIRLITEASPAVAVLVIAFFVIRSNSKQAETVQNNMTAVIKLAGSISENTKAVESAITAMAADQERQLERVGNTLTENVKTAAEKAEESRQRWAHEISGHFVTLHAKLEAVETVLACLQRDENTLATSDQIDGVTSQLAQMRADIQDNWLELRNFLIQQSEQKNKGTSVAPDDLIQ